MGMLPTQESYVADLALAFDCDLTIPALDGSARIGQATSASLNVRYVVVDNGCVDASAEIVETVRGLDVARPRDLVSLEATMDGSSALHRAAPAGWTPTKPTWGH